MPSTKRHQRADLTATANHPFEMSAIPFYTPTPRRCMRSRVGDVIRKYAARILHIGETHKKETAGQAQDTLSNPPVACDGHADSRNEDDVQMANVRQIQTPVSYDGPSIFSRTASATSSAASSLLSGSFQTTSIRVPPDQIPVCVSITQPTWEWAAKQKRVIKWEWDPQWEAHYAPWAFNIKKLSVAKMKTTIGPYVSLAGIDKDTFQVEYLNEGTWNAAFKVWSTEDGFTHNAVLKIPKPIMPWYKTQSEVATMTYIREHTKVPVPKVFAFDSSTDNALQLEWILMEMAEGQEYEQIKEDFSPEEDQDGIYRKVAEWTHELQGRAFDMIGSIYREWDPTADNYLDYCIGPGVIQARFTADRGLGLPNTYGPFLSMRDWYASLLEAKEADVGNDVTTKAKKKALADRFDARIHTILGQRTAFESQRTEVALLLRGRRRGRHAEAKQRLHSLLFNTDQMDPRTRLAELQCLRRGYAKLMPRIVKAIGDHVMQEIAVGIRLATTYTDKRDALSDFKSALKLEAEHHHRMAERLKILIPLVCGHEPLAHKSTWLDHWDISGRNIMVKEDTKEVMLLDWEQLITKPFVMGNDMPPVIERHGETDDNWYQHCRRFYGSRRRKLNAAWPTRLDEAGQRREEDLNRLLRLIEGVGTKCWSNEVRADVEELCKFYGVEYFSTPVGEKAISFD
ncbi:hypothetical protein BU16DRAFT_532774 [Lophium mytilinum]|uniref:Aminoglycoside phosphotransferase domain-containing protein n=1 Tax=Lophium mytilinum TaxID=390894 RepID=A0A6A6RCL6_9PEZI|nr:hypothetical protein BU16DRAFT_532774 [Lophium mytilinum]